MAQEGHFDTPNILKTSQATQKKYANTYIFFWFYFSIH